MLRFLSQFQADIWLKSEWIEPFEWVEMLRFRHIIGMLLSYFLIFPLTLRFLATYSVSSEVNNTIQLSSYIDTMVVLSLLMGIVFEIPMIAWLMAKLKLVTSDFMKRYRKHAIVIAFVISAIITPTTDIITLLLVGLPVIVLYEISIFIVRYTAE